MSKKSGQKNALIFGATGGIGRAIAKKMRAMNINPYLVGRSRQKLESLRIELDIQSSQTFRAQSITSGEGYEKTNDWLSLLNVQFDFGIHAAGAGIFKTAEKLTLSEWVEIIDVNLNSAFAFYKLFRPVRNKQEFDLVFFGSASTEREWPKNTLYGASKVGLEMFADCLRQEIKGQGGRVWLYQPGSVDTSFFDRVKNHMPKEKMIKPDILAKIVVNNLYLERQLYYKSIPLHSE